MHNTSPVIVITGASAGVGRATAHAFAREGAKIALISRGKAGLEAALKEVQQLGGRGMIIPTDVSDANAVEAAAARIEEQLGPIDVWVNNAMISVFSPVKETTAEEFRRVMEVTYLGYVHGTLAALKRMLPRDHGTIIQVGSALAYRGIPLQAAYCAAKHAIQGFCDSLRCELLHDRSKIHLTMVQMPALNTPQFSWVKSRLPQKAQPVPPIFQPEVAAEAILYASKHRRREIYVGGPTVEAVVGNRIAPGLLDHYLAWKGYDSQQTAEKEDPSRPDNLHAPLDDQTDHGTHGAFDSKAHRASLQLWANVNRGWLSLGLTAAAALAIGGRTFLSAIRDKLKRRVLIASAD